jgi:hypothetical protein
MIRFAADENLNRRLVTGLQRRTRKLDVVRVQAEASGDNPQGCWNWWGYGGDSEYDTRDGGQMRTIMAMIDALE